ncbi:MAG: hypothetical protein LH613_01625 [Chamaesiphon sp.]|nr:hypothetical protein [Chamaesiphon sp.]
MAEPLPWRIVQTIFMTYLTISVPKAVKACVDGQILVKMGGFVWIY